MQRPPSVECAARLLRRALLLTVAMVLLPGAAAGQEPFAMSAAPNPVTVRAGGPPVNVVVSTAPSDVFREPIIYSFSGFPAGISTDGARTVTPPYPAVTFAFSASASVAPGTYTGMLVGTLSGRSVTAPMTVIVQRPDFAVAASPAGVTLVAGEAGTVSVSVSGTGGFAGAVSIAANATGGVSVEPASFTVAAGASRSVVIRAPMVENPAAATVTFSGTADGVAGARTASVAVSVRPPAPVVDAVVPAALRAGTPENVLRVTGRFFHPAAVITSAGPAVRVVRARVISPTSAEVVVATRSDAPPGAYRLDVRNPDGATAAGGAVVRVHSTASLAGPLAVTGARIVTPRPWQIVAEDEAVHAHALLATSGMGTIVGTWLLDGVPFDRFTRIVSAGQPVEVRSSVPIPVSFRGEHRLELVIESPASLPPQRVAFFQAPESRSGLRLLEPGATGVLDAVRPAVRWSLVPAASGYEVELLYRDTGADEAVAWTSLRRRVTGTEWQPERALLDRLRRSEMQLRVRPAFPGDVFGEPPGWRVLRFGVDEPGSGAAPPDRPPPGPDPPGIGGEGSLRSEAGHADAFARVSAAPHAIAVREELAGAFRQVELGVGLMTTTESPSVPGPWALTRLQLSNQSDIRGDDYAHQLAGDFTAAHDLGDPWRSRAESRSWLAQAALTEGVIRPQARIGFAPPSFFDRSEFLSVFGAGGAVHGGVHTPVGQLSYYRSVRLSAENSAGPEPTVTAAAYELPTTDGRFTLRATTLHVTDRPLDEFTPGGTGEAFGFLAAAEISPWVALLGEGAFGRYRPGEGALQDGSDGTAFRLAAHGGAGTFAYSAAVGRTAGGFVNPVNPGFTPGGISGRTRAELTLSNTFFGRASLTGGYSHVRSGSPASDLDPRTRESGAHVSLSMPVTTRVSLSLAGNLAGQRGDGVEDMGMPATDRTQKGVTLNVTQSLGRIQLTQSVGWQDLSDRGQPWADQSVTNVQLGAHGAVHRLVSISANASETRIDGAEDMGGSRQRLLSVQPAVTVFSTGISLIPRAAWTRSVSDLQDGALHAAHYQLGVRWTAPWNRVPVSAEVSSDWRRSWSDLDDDPPGFTRRTVFSLGLNWRADRAW